MEQINGSNGLNGSNGMLYLVPKGCFGGKGMNIQFSGKDEIVNRIRAISVSSQYGYLSKFRELNLFIQGDSEPLPGREGWIMVEAWSDNQDLFFQFAEHLAQKLNLQLEIGLPTG